MTDLPHPLAFENRIKCLGGGSLGFTVLDHVLSCQDQVIRNRLQLVSFSIATPNIQSLWIKDAYIPCFDQMEKMNGKPITRHCCISLRLKGDSDGA